MGSEFVEKKKPYYKCFHVALTSISLTEEGLTAYNFAISFLDFILFFKNSLIKITSAALNFALCLFSPLHNLPFFIISSVLSFAEPTKRCSGLTQDVKSQECSTRSFPASPLFIFQENLCASDPLVRIFVNIPYPLLFLPPVQVQQLESDLLYGCFGPFLSTFEKKRSFIGFGFGPLFMFGELS